MKTATLCKNEDESGRRLCEHRGTIFEARIEGERHHCHETILRYVQKAPDDIRWKIDRSEFDELTATKKNAPQVPTGVPYKHVIEGGPVPALFASQILRCRQQWPYCEIARGPTSVVTVIARFSPLRFVEAFNGTP